LPDKGFDLVRQYRRGMFAPKPFEVAKNVRVTRTGIRIVRATGFRISDIGGADF